MCVDFVTTAPGLNLLVYQRYLRSSCSIYIYYVFPNRHSLSVCSTSHHRKTAKCINTTCTISYIEDFCDKHRNGVILAESMDEELGYIARHRRQISIREGTLRKVCHARTITHGGRHRHPSPNACQRGSANTAPEVPCLTAAVAATAAATTTAYSICALNWV